MKRLFDQLREWVEHPLYSDGTLLDWIAGIVFILVLSFLWSTVVSKVAES